MGFFDKINYSMIVNAFKQVCDRRHREMFFTTTGRNKLVALGSQAAKLQSVAVSVGGDLNT